MRLFYKTGEKIERGSVVVIGKDGLLYNARRDDMCCPDHDKEQEIPAMEKFTAYAIMVVTCAMALFLIMFFCKGF